MTSNLQRVVMTLDVMADTIGLMKEKNIYNKLKNIVNTFEAKLEYLSARLMNMYIKVLMAI